MRVPISYQPGGVGPTICAVGGGGRRQFLSYRQELLSSSRQDKQVVPDIQQPEVKYNFSSYESDDGLPVTANEYQTRSHTINNV